MLQPHTTRWFAARVALILCGFILLAGCASPTHVAEFWLQARQELSVVVKGERPTIEIANRGPGAIGRVDWIDAGRVTRLGGISPCDENMFTLTDGASIRLGDGMGCKVRVRLWNADGYELNFAPVDATIPPN